MINTKKGDKKMKIKKETKIKLIDKLDFDKIHKMQFDSWGRRVEIWLETDGEGNEYLKPVIMEQNTWQPDAIVIGSFGCFGGNYDASIYAEGWAEKKTDENGDVYYLTDENKQLSEMEMIYDCIDEGDWEEEYESQRKYLLEQWEEYEN